MTSEQVRLAKLDSCAPAGGHAHIYNGLINNEESCITMHTSVMHASTMGVYSCIIGYVRRP
jgi:hypothetical protein